MKKYAYLVLVFACVLIVSAASTKSSLEAESYLGRGETFLNIKDYRNALMNAHLAKTLYSEIGDSGGVSRAQDLIARVESQTTPSLRAGYYYAMGSDYFFSVNEDMDSYETLIDSYNKAKYFSRLSRDLYESVGDKPSEIKAYDLLQEIGKKIERIQNQERARADSYYSAARTSLLNKDYASATSYAGLALEIYTNISYSDGVDNAKLMKSKINEATSEIKKNAETALRTSKSYYGENNYEESLKYAEKARELFESINDELGLLESQDMISLLNSHMEKGVEERKTQAALLYRQAQDDLIKLKCEDAILNAKESRSLYWGLRDEAKTDSEEDLYDVLINDCSVLIARIISDCGLEDITNRANLYYKQAQEFYLRGYYKEALSYAQKSESFHSDVENYVGVEKARSLIDEITEAINKEKAFSNNMSLARTYTCRADFQNAKIHLGFARSVASTLLYAENKTKDVDDLQQSVFSGEEKLINAKSNYDFAYDSFSRAEYDTAENSVKTAIGIYREINYSMGLNQSMLLYEKISEKKSEISSRLRMTILSVLAVALVIFLIVVNYLKKKKDMEREKQIITQKLEQEKKEEERKWKIEEESKTKKRVEDEFRRMIEAERMHEVGGTPPLQEQSRETPNERFSPPSQITQPSATTKEKKSEKAFADSGDSLEDEIKKLEAKLRKEAEEKGG